MDSEHSHTKWCVDKAVDFINTLSTSETPWLFSVNIFDPHHSFNPPEEYLQRYLDMIDEIPTPEYTEGELENKSHFANKDHTGAYDTPGHLEFDAMTDMDHQLVKAAYWAMVDNIDAQVGRLLDSLEETDQLENTIIIFTSDHGELLGDHGIYLKGPHFYECSIHVPLIISWPKKIQGGTKNNQLVELVDIAPTILEAANLDIYEGMQGKSLMTQFENDDTVHKENIYCEYYNSNINHVDPKAYGTMIFDGQYKLIKYHGDKEKIKCIGELYDLESDPNETINRWDDESYKEIKIEMLGKLCDKMAYISDPLPVRKSFW
jgi:arylsulfatase A-like enzyme